MIEINKKYIVLIIVGLISIWILAIVIHSKKGGELRAEYKIIKFEDEVNSTVLKLKKIKGTCYIKTDNSSISLLSSQNYLYENEYSHNNLFLGDSIFKRAKSDTIYIFSPKGEMKYFVHEKVINRPNR